MSTDDAAALLQRLAHTPGAVQWVQERGESMRQWATWGGRGWVGILRSWGL